MIRSEHASRTRPGGAHRPGGTRSPGRASRQRLNAARLYLILGARPGGRPAPEVVGPALAGGVDMVQLRERSLDDGELVAVARALRELCDRYGALLILDDRTDLVSACMAHGVHLGQGDTPVEEARALLGSHALIGVSTHSPVQIAAAGESAADYMGVGPVYATPTKPGVAPVGHALVRYAAEQADKPFFAIGGIDSTNVGDVVAAGARRLAVVRAVAEAADPRAAAASLRRALDPEVSAGAR